MPTRFSLTRLIVLTAALFVAACEGPALDPERSPSTTTEARSASSEPRYGGNIVLAASAAPLTLNMLYVQDIPTYTIASLISDGLMEVDEKFELQPRLAIAAPEISPDGTVWTYRLHEDVRFHDGVPLTAHDVAFTYRLILHPDFRGPWRAQFRSLASVEVVDDRTVRFTLSEPDARFAGNTPGILPRHLLEHVPAAELGDYRAFNVEHPIGAGPFKFASWTAGENLVLEAFDGYYAGRPYVDRVTFRFVPNSSARVLALEAGEVDHTAVPSTEVATVRAMPHVVLHDALTSNYSYIGWNLRNLLFADRRVRQALTHAIDRQEIVDTILEGQALVAHSPASPAIAWAYTDDVPRFEHDVERAKALLAEAGWAPGPDGILQKGGVRFEFEILTSEGGNADVLLVVQQALRSVGIQARVTQMEWGALLQRVRPPSAAFEALQMGWQLQESADPSLQWHTRSITEGSNQVGFSDARVDELIDQSVRLLDRDERAAVLKEVWRILAEEQPHTFMYHPRQFIAVSADVRGYVQNPSRQTYRLERWWLHRD